MSDRSGHSLPTDAPGLLAHLGSRGVEFILEGDRLQVRAPAGVVDSGVQAALRQHKLAIVQLLQEPPGALANEGTVPLAPVQERIWFFQQMNPGSATYNLSQRVEITGPLDRDRFERALRDVRRMLQQHRIPRHQCGRRGLGARLFLDGDQVEDGRRLEEAGRVL